MRPLFAHRCLCALVAGLSLVGLGGQYCRMADDNLLLGQRLIGSAGGGAGHRDFAVGLGGIGLNF